MFYIVTLYFISYFSVQQINDHLQPKQSMLLCIKKYLLLFPNPQPYYLAS